MSNGKRASVLTVHGGGQFSKFSVNRDRPPKRRRNARNAQAGPSSTAIASDSSAAGKRMAKDSGKDKADVTRSCAECKRMKLKCDRVFPCITCVRRGLEGICPEGSLVSGRGTRYVLASTEKLHEKILRMADRIKNLEDALSSLHHEHASCRPCSCQSNAKQDPSVQPHPLLRDELLLIKGQLELYGLGPAKEQEKYEQGSLENLPSGSASPLEDVRRATTVPSASLKEKNPDPEVAAGDDTFDSHKVERLPPSTEGEAKGLSHGLSHGREQPYDKVYLEERGRRLRAMLPPRKEAEHLAREAIWNGAWILNITSRPADRAQLLYKLYDGPLRAVRAQDVALALAAFAIGARVDIGPGSSSYTTSSIINNTSPSCAGACSSSEKVTGSGDARDENMKKEDGSDGKMERETGQLRSGSGMCSSRAAQENFYLAKAALSEVLMQNEPDVTIVHCLYLMTWYLAALADIKDAGREATVLMSLAVRVAFKIGMHREETYEGLSEEEQQERRILFWGVLHVESRLRLGSDCRGALGTMRITTKRPLTSIPGAIKSFQTHAETLYHDFKIAFLEACVVPATAAIAKAPELRLQEHDYYDVLALDRLIRDFEVPSILAQPIGTSSPTSSCESVPITASANFATALNPNASPSTFDLNYGGGKTPRNVLTMIRSKIQQEKFITLLYLHRTFFYAHIRDHRSLVQRRFLPSAIACFSAACALIQNVQDVFVAEPELAARVGIFWYNAFVGATSLFMLVVYKPFCPVSVLALQEIKKARNLFLTASPTCHMASRSYPILREFYTKASEVFDRWQEESEGEMKVFGPNGEVFLCQTRIDIVIQRLQRVTVPSADEEDATTGLLSLKRRRSGTFSEAQESGGKLPLCAPQSEMEADEQSSELFYDMWQHAHRELTDVVRRVPEVLKDAVVDPRRATAARLIWGFIPLPEESNVEAMEEVHTEAGLPADLDWSVFADALMYVPAAHTGSLGVHPVQLGLPSPPETTYSPEGSQSSFSMLDICTDFKPSIAGACTQQIEPSRFVVDANMNDATTTYCQDGRPGGLLKHYGKSPQRSLTDESALEYVHGEDVTGIGYISGHDTGYAYAPLASDRKAEVGTLAHLWQHRVIRSPYLSSTLSAGSLPSTPGSRYVSTSTRCST